MSRAIHETTPSGDEVTLEASAQLSTRGRTVAQVEHNAMQALDLVRATLAALSGIMPALDRFALLLANARSVSMTTLAPEMQRVVEQLGQSIHAAALRDDPLLTGGSATFAVDDPNDQSSCPLQIDLPDLTAPFAELAELDLGASTHALVASKQAHLTSQITSAKKQLLGTSQRLSRVLASQRPAPQHTYRTAEDEGFVAMIQTVRESVLHAGDAALRVQGSPSARATWLIEALRDAR